MLVVRHRDEPGRAGDVFDALRDEHLNVQETENIVFNGAEAAVARINLDARAVGRRSQKAHARATPNILRHPGRHR